MTDPIWPVFIATKGRPTTQKTLALLTEAGVRPTLVIEPQEYEAYKTCHPDITKVRFMVLKENDQGIGYVRQSILEWCREREIPWYWMMDDDIQGFYRAEEGKTFKTDAKTLLMACQSMLGLQPMVAQAGIEYQQFAWSARKPAVFGSYCDVCVAIHTGRTAGINYRRELDLKEDRDFTLQVLANSGFTTVRFSWWAFSAPKNGSNKGGLHDEYKREGREREASERMIKAWPGVCSLNVKKDGRPDVKINWSFFKPRT